MYALLETMAALPAPSEEVLDRLEAFFNPYHTPEGFVPFLASWVNMDWVLLENAAEFSTLTPPLPSGTGRLRELVASATFLAQWRGTAKGLLRFLETASGVQGFTVEEQIPGPDGRPRPFHITIHAPAEATPYQPMLKRIIEAEKPAYVTYDLLMMENAEQKKSTVQ